MILKDVTVSPKAKKTQTAVALLQYARGALTQIILMRVLVYVQYEELKLLSAEADMSTRLVPCLPIVAQYLLRWDPLFCSVSSCSVRSRTSPCFHQGGLIGIWFQISE